MQAADIGWLSHITYAVCNYVCDLVIDRILAIIWGMFVCLFVWDLFPIFFLEEHKTWSACPLLHGKYLGFENVLLPWHNTENWPLRNAAFWLVNKGQCHWFLFSLQYKFVLYIASVYPRQIQRSIVLNWPSMCLF